MELAHSRRTTKLVAEAIRRVCRTGHPDRASERCRGDLLAEPRRPGENEPV